MTSPGGPARVSGPAPATAGTNHGAQGAPESPAGEALRPVPEPADDPVPPPAAPGGDGEGTPTPDDTGGGDGSWPGAGPDTGTVRRSRPSRSPRSATGVPTPPSPMTAGTAPAGASAPAGGDGAGPELGPATGPAPVIAQDPPHRPVPPTFPSAGQPPPGVARRQGRHARPERTDASTHTPPPGYRPRHAAPDAETEQFAATPFTGPGGSGPAPLVPATGGAGGAVPVAAGAGAPVDPAATTGSTPTVTGGAATSAALHTGPGVVVPPLPATDDAAHSDRVRVVLAERRVPTRAVRTVAEIEQQTETGELLLRNLLRAQLALGLRLGLVAVFVLGALPVLFLVLPRVGTFEIAGVTLPWLVVGLLPYPFMLALAWLYTRTAERNELDFADNVED